MDRACSTSPNTTSRTSTSASTATPTANRRPACSGRSGRGRFTLQGAYGSRRKVVPTGSYETTLDDRNVTVDSRGWIDATVTGSFKGAALSGRAFGDYTGYDGAYVYLDGTSTASTPPTAPGSGVEGHGVQAGRRRAIR